MNVTRILRSTPAAVTLTTYRDGVATDIGTVTVTATKADGTALFTDQAVTDGADGTYTFTFTDEQTADLNFLTLVWEASGGESYTTYVEIVGGHLFTEAQARAFKIGAATPMSDATKYPDATVAEARDRITDLLETATGVSWIPRFQRLQRRGTGNHAFWLPHHRVTEVLSASIGGTAQTVGDITIEENTGRLYHTAEMWARPTVDDPLNVTVEYIHGYESLKDGVDYAALRWLASSIVETNVPDAYVRSTGIANEFGNIRFAPFSPSGDPFVDRWVLDHDERLPV